MNHPAIRRPLVWLRCWRALRAWQRIRPPPAPKPAPSPAPLPSELAALAEAASDFRTTATVLVTRLAVRLAVPLSAFWDRRLLDDVAPCEWLDAQWLYHFHGFQCSFRHQQTGQTVAVNLHYPGEFGVLDPQFFAEFLCTTPRWAALSPLCHDYHGGQRVLAALAQAGHLRQVPAAPLRPPGWAARG